MATVYLAHDVKHDRKVAIKVLKPELAAVVGAERFVIEINTTAALQHPHILPLFDSGDADGFLYYVMPYVEGETIREKLNRETQFGVDEAVRIAREVADALDYAHRHGVIHRDIKPENILLHDGRAMVMDFGIALAVSAAAGGRMTETGLSLGTPHYMSPEQATAEREITGRSDIYSLASVLYEMLAGVPPHEGGSAQQTIMRIITDTPRPVTELRRSVPPHVAAAVSQALEKLPADRFENAKAFEHALGDPGFRRATDASTSRRATSRRDPWRIGLGAIALLATAAAAWLGTHRTRATTQSFRFVLALPAGQELAAPGGSRLEFSPDGQSFVYTGAGVGAQLWLRRMNSLEAVRIAGSDGATCPVFSPDGSEIGFVTTTPFRLKTVSVEGGQTRTIGVPFVSGGGLAWASNGFIYFDAGTGLGRVRPDGSGYAMVMPLDTAGGESGVAWPSALPNARGILMRVRRGGEAPSNYSVVVLDLRTGARKELVRGLAARYSPTGHLIWATADGSLHAQRFDLDRLRLTGSATTLWGGLAIAGFGAVDLALSPSGDLLYTLGAVHSNVAELVWVSRNGSKARVDAPPEDGIISALALSPDDSSVALELVRPTAASDLTRIWVKRLHGGPTQLVTSEPSNNRNPVWTPDGRDLLYSSLGDEVVERRRADGSGNPEPVLRTKRGVNGLAVSPDGKTVLLATQASRAADQTAGGDLLQFRIGVDSNPVPLFATPASEQYPTLSPDGRWLAYASKESGRFEVYVSPFPEVNTGKVQVSVAGGVAPHWSRKRDELFFVSASGDMTSARVRTSPTFSVLGLDRLFSTAGFLTAGPASIYDVTADAQRFLMLNVAGSGIDASTGEIVFVQNFAAELARRSPNGGER
jgi:serine/threonine-protein kinase